jgi:epoxyqueuosine reductase
VRGAAVWALSRLLPAERLAALAMEHRPRESEPLVLEEWSAALEPAAT